MAFRSSFLAALAVVLAVISPQGALAQGELFSPAVYVNDRIITRYEVEQNRLFLELLRQPGNIAELAVERLIEDNLRRDAAEAAGIAVTPEEVDAGMAEFASRSNLTTEEFISALADGGVSEQTFRAFVEAGLLWRGVIRARFGPRAQVTDAEVDRAVALSSRQSGIQVLISELVLRADSPEARAEAERVGQRLAGQFMSEGAFAAEARERSVSPSRDRGGRLDWLPLGNLPPPVAAQVIGLAPGQVSQPYPVTNAIVLFYLRDLRETQGADLTPIALEWAEFAVASAEEAARVRARVDTCDDLYGVAKGLPEERLRRETRAFGEVPSDLGMALAQLDENEIAAGFTRGGRPVVLMLCARTYDIAPVEAEAAADGVEGEAGPSRETIRNQLIGQRLNSYSEGYMAELRADATIRFP